MFYVTEITTELYLWRIKKPNGEVMCAVSFWRKFECYINDLPKCVSSHCALFADDCLLYRKINNKEDHQILQHNLHNLELWANKWLMSFNVSKCEVLRISLRNALEFSYILYNFPLHIVSEAIDI